MRNAWKRTGRGALTPPEVTKAIRYENSDGISVDRIRAVGGRSIHWNAVCLRFADRDFRERSPQGVEEDWPLTYQELCLYITPTSRR